MAEMRAFLLIGVGIGLAGIPKTPYDDGELSVVPSVKELFPIPVFMGDTEWMVLQFPLEVLAPTR